MLSGRTSGQLRYNNDNEISPPETETQAVGSQQDLLDLLYGHNLVTTKKIRNVTYMK